MSPAANYLADMLKSLAQPTRLKIIDFRELELRSGVINSTERNVS